jgi:ATP-dependent Clp protease adapter protein ClpS
MWWICKTAMRNDTCVPMPLFSGTLERSLSRAIAAANQRQHEYATVEHLLLALVDDEDAGRVMRGCNVDLEKLRRDLIACIESENSITDGSKDAKPAEGFHRVIRRAATHVESVEREKITGADVLVAILAERESRAADFLQLQRATRYELTRYISHGIGRDRVALDRKGGDDPAQHTAADTPAGLTAQVLLLNDDYTPMEFVVHVLERMFDKDHETAVRIMYEIHHHGSGTCGIYPYDVADAKVGEVLSFAREHQHPLQCVLE